MRKSLDRATNKTNNLSTWASSLIEAVEFTLQILRLAVLLGTPDACNTVTAKPSQQVKPTRQLRFHSLGSKQTNGVCTKSQHRCFTVQIVCWLGFKGWEIALLLQGD